MQESFSKSILFNAFPKDRCSFLATNLPTTTYQHVYLNSSSLCSFFSSNHLPNHNLGQNEGDNNLREKFSTDRKTQSIGLSKTTKLIEEFCSFTPAILSYTLHDHSTNDNEDNKGIESFPTFTSFRTIVYLLFDTSIKEGDILIEDWFFDLSGISLGA